MPLHAQNVHTSVNTDSITAGEVFELSMLVQLDREYKKVAFPDTTAFPPTVSIVDREQYRRSQFSDSLVYNLQYFGVDDLQIPPLPVTLIFEEDSTTLYTDPVLLYFKTVVAEGDTTLKPMKPNYEFPLPLWPWVLAAAVLAAFLVWWFYFREEKEKEEKKEPVLEPFYNPLDALEKRLHTLKRETDLPETKDYKTFYSEISDAIRAYYEELYNIPALESTSGELLRYLDVYDVDQTLAEATRKVLRQADLVKFAKFTPTLDDAWKTYDYALEFLERAKESDRTKIRRLRREYDLKKERFLASQSEEEEN
ncbi:hypothetical protein [Gracilimonas mengyeensis]|nr:hypothetical protein [Gracilimonas mengyeensis]